MLTEVDGADSGAATGAAAGSGARRTLILILTIVVMGLVGVALLVSGRSTAETFVQPEVRSTATVRVEDERGLARSPGAEATSSVITSEQFLTDYWGGGWPDVKAAMEGKNLPYTTWPPVLITWEAARPGLEEQIRFTPEELVLYKQQFMRWNGTADREWIINNFGGMPSMTPESFQRVQEIGDVHQLEIDLMATDLVDGLQAEAVAALYDGRAVHAPYTTIGAPGYDPDRQVFYGTGEGYKGWSVSVGFTWDEVPHLQALQSELNKLVDARDREIAAFLWPKKSK